MMNMAAEKNTSY